MRRASWESDASDHSSGLSDKSSSCISGSSSSSSGASDASADSGSGSGKVVAAIVPPAQPAERPEPEPPLPPPLAPPPSLVQRRDGRHRQTQVVAKAKAGENKEPFGDSFLTARFGSSGIDGLPDDWCQPTPLWRQPQVHQRDGHQGGRLDCECAADLESMVAYGARSGHKRRALRPMSGRTFWSAHAELGNS